MPIEIKMPALSPTMTEGNLVKWLKKEGDKIKSGDIIAEIETDKATMELESSNSGVFGKIIIQEGTEAIKVNTLIALMLKNGEDKSALESFVLKESESKIEETKEEEPIKSEANNVEVSQTSEVKENSERVFASPLAKRIAENHNIDLATLEGSGPNGRVVKQDVEGAKQQPKITPINALGRKGDSTLPLTSIRKVIAKRLLESKTQVPHFYLSVDVNMVKLLTFRAEVNTNLQNAGIKISVNDLIIKASSFALRDFPSVNASFNESHITMYGNVDISVAVSTNTGLITPIVKNADIKSISQISIEMKELAQKAKENKLKPEEFQGGSFSISNLGMFGIKNFNAIINPPQSAILAIGGTEKKPVFNEQLNQFVPIDVMNITLSADHRIVDGVLGAEFLNKIKFYLENPMMFAI